MSRVPCGTDRIPVVQAEPARMARPWRGGTARNDLETDRFPEPHRVVVRAHVRVAPAERDIQAEAGLCFCWR